MTSKVQIFNLALSHIGAVGRVQDPAENSNEAIKCATHYDSCLSEMQEFPYSFLKTTRSLSEVTNDYSQRWQYAYTEPNSMVKLVRIVPEIDIPGAAPIPYARRGGNVYCDVSPCELEYTQAVTDPSKFPSHFVIAMSWALAARICFPLTKNEKLRDTTYQIADARRQKSETFEANNEGQSDEWVAPHIEARN